MAALFGFGADHPALVLGVGWGALALAVLLVIRGRYVGKPAGVRNDGVFHRSLTARGAIAWALGIAFTAYYVALYWFPESIAGITRLFDPLSRLLRG
ncbi:MAG: FeS-binding protein, partial [Flavobacteriales bacterium]|nr:FeS-binding protein [Flavobacteriales bacterium]HPJ53426.1 FeS-binding protein [Flavobacteriales bacterium]